MLFNSYAFIFLYLPIVFLGMFWLSRYNRRVAALWLGLASLVFYAVWDARFVVLLLLSVVFNYSVGYWIANRRAGKESKHTKPILVTAIIGNLLLLGYFKYANFFVASINQFFGSSFPALAIILPLGISFFTFTQIAFLVDVDRGIVREYSFTHYLLFVSFFPQLIAGPVLHHKQMMPQFADPRTYRINPEHVAVGLTIFILGLAKKVLLADSVAGYATPVFDAARANIGLAPLEAWIGVFAYTLQIYFDFSGYSDMAVGLSLLFNVRLPLNFDSPYKALSIIDFWRRWHMTLSAFLRDYLYISLGGNRKGPTRRYANLMITMLLGGLWHGAGWTFIVWGGLRGLYLIINHVWRGMKTRMGWTEGGRLARLASGLLTFLAVVVAWVFFRADSMASAWTMLSSMAGLNEMAQPVLLGKQRPSEVIGFPHLNLVFSYLVSAPQVPQFTALAHLTLGLALVWCFPNVRQMLAAYKPTWEDIAGVQTPTAMTQGRFLGQVSWTLTTKPAIAAGIVFFISLLYMASNQTSEFLYFQF